MDIERWLEGVGLPQYKAAFLEHGIDDEVLQQLTADDLKDLGITLIGHRRKLLTAIESLRASANGPEDESVSAASQPVSAASPERRHLTVLFCDLVGSTALSARLDPEDLREVIRNYHSTVADVARSQGGFVAQYLGDGALVYFGFPVAHEDDAERAVRAAIMLRDITQSRDAKGEPLQVRCGLATGLVVVGDRAEGSKASHEPQVMGETPNRAARLQALAAPGGIVIDAATRKLVGRMFVLRERSPASLKGFDDLVEVWDVLRAAAIDSRFEALRSGETPLIGRNEELELLTRRWHQAKAGQGRLVLISGEPGLGKSRLVSAFESRIKGGPHIELRYFCSPQHTSTVLHPITTHAMRMAGLRETDAPATKIEKLRKLFPTGDDRLLVADLLSLPVDPKSGLNELAPQEKRAKLFRALVGRILELAAQSPVFLLMEDMHWVDPTTQEVLDALVSKIERLPILIILTFRPEFQPPWAGQANVTTLVLNRLSSDDCAALIRIMTARSDLAPRIVDEIVDRTDGIPLFAEELSKAVVEAGRVEQVKRGSGGQLQVPATLHASLVARLDLLGSEAREAAQASSVIGRDFRHSLLIRMLHQTGIAETAKVNAALDALVSSGLVFMRAAPPDAIYTFKHALVQDAAYSTLLRTQRQKLHAALAPLLAADPTIAPEVLAYHFAGAGEHELAVEYWYRAGRAANERSATSEAIRSFENALDILSELPDTRENKLKILEITSALCNPLIVSRWLMPETTSRITRAAQLAEELGASPPPVITYHQWLYHFGCANHQEALRLGRIFLKTGGPELQTRAQVCVANSIYMTGGSLESAIAHIEEGLRKYDRRTHASQRFQYTYEPRCVALTTLSLQLALAGYFDRAKAAEKEALEYAAEFDHSQTFRLILSYKLLREEFQKDYAEQQETARTLEEHANRDKVVFHGHWADVFRGFAAARAGRAHEGIAMIDRSLEAFAGMIHYYRPFHFGLRAQAYELAGDFDRALESAAEGIAVAKQSGERVVLSDLIRLSGDLQFRRDGEAASELAEKLFSEAIALAQAQRSKLHELRASTSLASLKQTRGEHRQADDLLRPVYDWFKEGLSSPDLLAARAVLDDLASVRERRLA